MYYILILFRYIRNARSTYFNCGVIDTRNKYFHYLTIYGKHLLFVGTANFILGKVTGNPTSALAEALAAEDKIVDKELFGSGSPCLSLKNCRTVRTHLDAG